MDVSYQKLWRLLLDRNMKKKDLASAAGLSTASIAKLSKNRHVSLDVLVRVCQVLHVDIGDIVQVAPNTAQ